MKHLKFLTLFFLAVSVGLTSCKKDEDAGDEVKKQIVGKWKVIKEYDINYENGQKVEEGPRDNTGDEHFIQLNSDGNGSWIYNSMFTISFSYSINSNGDKLTMGLGPLVQQEYTIKTLTSTSLVIMSDDTYTENGKTYRDIYEVTATK